MPLKSKIASIVGLTIAGTVAITGVKAMERLARLNVMPPKRKRKRRRK